MNTTASKLLIKTFDGSLFDFTVTPKCMDSSVEFNMAYYDYDGDKLSINEELTDKIVFRSKSGKFGNFNIAFIPVETSDYEEL